jgi:hypothetical protein
MRRAAEAPRFRARAAELRAGPTAPSAVRAASRRESEGRALRAKAERRAPRDSAATRGAPVPVVPTRVAGPRRAVGAPGASEGRRPARARAVRAPAASPGQRKRGARAPAARAASALTSALRSSAILVKARATAVAGTTIRQPGLPARAARRSGRRAGRTVSVIGRRAERTQGRRSAAPTRAPTAAPSGRLSALRPVLRTPRALRPSVRMLCGRVQRLRWRLLLHSPGTVHALHERPRLLHRSLHRQQVPVRPRFD